MKLRVSNMEPNNVAAIIVAHAQFVAVRSRVSRDCPERFPFLVRRSPEDNP